jgi:hypothetical protein
MARKGESEERKKERREGNATRVRVQAIVAM